MAGIYGIYGQYHTVLGKEGYTLFHSADFSHVTNEEKRYHHFIYGRSTINCYQSDRVMQEDDDVIIVFEGVFFNKEYENSFDTLKKWYQQRGSTAIRNIEGQFCGFIYDKKQKKLYLFNDHLGSKPLYIYHDKEYLLFASEFKVITALMEMMHIPKKLNSDAVYAMLTFGYMINGITYEKQCKKLAYGTILEADSALNVREHTYFQYQKEADHTLDRSEVIEKIDRLLLKSVAECWREDKAEVHYAFLSGGLDSRVNLFLAKELGYQHIVGLTFAQSHSSDHRIAETICRKEGFEHCFFALDHGTVFEKKLETYCSANDGLAVISGSAAGYSVLETFTGFSSSRFLHTGQLGDLLFGSYVKDHFSPKSGMMSNRTDLLSKISFWEEFEQHYIDHSELFGFEQRAVHATLNGDRMTSHFVDMLSPFYNRELISFCLTIPDHYKKDEAVYLEWFNAKHPKIAQYRWESAGVKPSCIIFVRVAKRLKRFKNALFRRIGLTVDDMNPFDVWLRENPAIEQNMNNIYYRYIDNVSDNELRQVLKTMYNTDIRYSHYGRNNKFLVVTLLLALELHFKDAY